MKADTGHRNKVKIIYWN